MSQQTTPELHAIAELTCQIRVAGKTKAMKVQADLSEEIKYKLCKECFNCEMYLRNLSVVTMNGMKATRY